MYHCQKSILRETTFDHFSLHYHNLNITQIKSALKKKIRSVSEMPDTYAAQYYRKSSRFEQKTF